MTIIPSVYDEVFKVRFHFLHTDGETARVFWNSMGFPPQERWAIGGRCHVGPNDRGCLHGALFVNNSWPLTSPEAIGVVAHEAVHAALMLFDIIGVERPMARADGTDEFLAYYTDFLVRSFLREAGAAKGKRKK